MAYRPRHPAPNRPLCLGNLPDSHRAAGIRRHLQRLPAPHLRRRLRPRHPRRAMDVAAPKHARLQHLFWSSPVALARAHRRGHRAARFLQAEYGFAVSLCRRFRLCPVAPLKMDCVSSRHSHQDWRECNPAGSPRRNRGLWANRRRSDTDHSRPRQLPPLDRPIRRTAPLAWIRHRARRIQRSGAALDLPLRRRRRSAALPAPRPQALGAGAGLLPLRRALRRHIPFSHQQRRPRRPRRQPAIALAHAPIDHGRSRPA